jgi:hypothetical protein
MAQRRTMTARDSDRFLFEETAGMVNIR